MSELAENHPLLDVFKERMIIDYSDKDKDLNHLLEESATEIERLVGSRDITNKSIQSLILSRARYVFNGQEEFFYDNFEKDILGLSILLYEGGNNGES